MSANERDTHFAGFAKLLLAELDDWAEIDNTNWRNDFQEIIARRVYDQMKLACEAIDTRQLEEGMRLTPEYMLKCVPDMEKWTE